MSFVTGPDGSNYLTNMQRTVVVNQRREMTQSVQVSSSTSGMETSTSSISSMTMASSGEDQRALTPDLVEEIPIFALPAGMSQETKELVHSPTQSRRLITPDDGDSLTVRVRQVK